MLAASLTRLTERSCQEISQLFRGEKEVLGVQVGHVEIDISIVVVVGGDNALGKWHPVDAGAMENVFEARLVFVSYEQIQRAVVIDIGPDRRLRVGCWLGNAARLRNIDEGPVAVIPEQRFAFTYRLPCSV